MLRAAMPLRTCLFPCAGLGTRIFPAAKAIPKEMLPLVDKPILEYGIEEALGSGLDRLIVVTPKGKDAILDHLDGIDVISVRQKGALGLGAAILRARHAVGDEPFAVALPDDVILAEEPCLKQMRRVFEQVRAPVVALMEVPAEETSRYAVAAGEIVGERLFRVRDIVEKPKSNPPSRYAIVGRYILPPEIFPILETTAGGGELQLTDALRRSGGVYGCIFEGTRYDAGEKLGYLKATVDYALRHDALGEAFAEVLRSALEKHGEEDRHPRTAARGARARRRM